MVRLFATFSLAALHTRSSETYISMRAFRAKVASFLWTFGVEDRPLGHNDMYEDCIVA